MKYEIVADNIGSVYSGSNKAEASKTFTYYKRMCRAQYGRIGETVTFFQDGELVKEYNLPESKPKHATYEGMKQALTAGLKDLSVISGDEIGDYASWQEGAKAASVKFAELARLLRLASLGKHESCIVFPSASDVLESSEDE